MAAIVNADNRAQANKGGGSTGRQFLVAMIVVGVLASGIGAGLGFLLKSVKSKPIEKRVESTAAVIAPSAKAQLVALPPIVTNLKDPSSVWVRLEASVLMDPVDKQTSILTAKIASDFLAYIRTASLHQLQGSIGLENLQAALDERAAARSDGKARDVLIRTLVFQ